MSEAQLTDAEAAVYDRQIRVWGVDTQQKLRSARVLFVGLTGVASEVAKNVTLAGLGSVSLLDDRLVAENHPGNFLVQCDADPSHSVAAASVAVLKEMNPLVTIEAVPGPVDAMSPEDFRSYQVVVLSGGSFQSQVELNQRCREAGVKFFATRVDAFAGYFFADLLSHSYTVQDALSTRHWTKLPRRCSQLYLALCVLRETERELNRPVTATDIETVKAIMQRIASEKAYSAKLPAELLESMLSNDMEHPAISAMVGGFLGQEVLKAVTARNAPLKNLFLYDLGTGDGKVEDMTDA